MALTRTQLTRLIRIVIGGIIAILILIYAVSRSLDYAKGPVIDIISPADGTAIYANTVVIQGHADRINSLSLDGDPISVDTHGDFSQTVIVFPGVNVLTLAAHDQFNRTTDKELTLVGMSELPVKRVIQAATSTATST